MKANGSEKKTTKSACAWKKTKKFRFAFGAQRRAERLVAAVLLLAEDTVEEQVAAEAEAPERRQRRGEHAVTDVAVREQRVERSRSTR